MDAGIDARQIERVLSHLARLGQCRDQDDGDDLENLRPAWLGTVAWEVVLDDLKTQYYRERKHVARLRLVR
ncbi:MAG: hypothetical protein ACTHJP_06440 [Rhodanobacteraceae bacterium]